MKKPVIKYIGFYELQDSKSGRVFNIPAIKKMDYVADAITRAGFSVNIISPSWMGDLAEVNLSGQKKIDIKNNLEITFFPSWRHRTKTGRNLKILFSLIWLFLYLILNTRKNEKIIVYHAQWLSWPIRLSKRIRKFQVILEVEEIYGEVWENSWIMNSWEKTLLNSADSYIFVSDKLQDKFKSTGKQSLVLYGAYQRKDRKNYHLSIGDVTHLVYAGSIDKVKGGAYKSLEIIKNLPSNYKLHILGSGSSQCINELNKEIQNINREKECEAVVYVGSLHGEKFTDYLMKCDLALNPQNQGEYMNTAFPSKVITYLSHDLKVISTPIESIIQSKIASNIIFTSGDSSEEFTKVIINDKSSNLSNEFNIIDQLDEEFINDLKDLLSN